MPRDCTAARRRLPRSRLPSSAAASRAATDPSESAPAKGVSAQRRSRSTCVALGGSPISLIESVRCSEPPCCCADVRASFCCRGGAAGRADPAERMWEKRQRSPYLHEPLVKCTHIWTRSGTVAVGMASRVGQRSGFADGRPDPDRSYS
eukprot:scaffold10191_cov108-Isochrysis_galbana.AAC.5